MTKQSRLRDIVTAPIDKRGGFCYTAGMNIQKIAPAAMPAEESFTFSEQKVQGAAIAAQGEYLCVRSPRRYKLFTEGEDVLLVLAGGGHFKWKRGELPFAAGDCFCISAVGEYEVNGACTFIVRRSKRA